MWERPDSGSTDSIEIPMFVTSVDVVPDHPDGAWNGEADDEALTDPEQIADPAMMPRQGTGTWPNGERAVRLGNAEEILITLASDPFSAMKAARSGAVFGTPIARLRVDESSRRDGDFETSWDAALRTAPLRWRHASLRIYASPSLNVTVMTIVPTKANRVAKRTFVRHGLRAARQVGRRVEACLAASSIIEA